MKQRLSKSWTEDVSLHLLIDYTRQSGLAPLALDSMQKVMISIPFAKIQDFPHKHDFDKTSRIDARSLDYEARYKILQS